MNSPFPSLGHRVFYVWLRNAVSYKRFMLPTFIGSVAEPLLYLIAVGLGIGSYMGLIDGIPYLNFIAPGLIVSTVMFACAFECTYASMSRMTMEKVYNSELVTPVSAEEIIAGEILWGMTRGMISGAIMLTILSILGIAHGWALILYPMLWFIVAFLFSSLSMVMTSLARNFDFFTYYFQLFISPMFFFSGIFFPLDHFPASVRTIANFLPLTHAVSISRALISGIFTTTQVWQFMALVIAGTIFFLLALKRMKRRIIT